VAKNNNHPTPLDSDTDSFVRNIREMSMTSIEPDRGAVDQCASNIKEIDRGESRGSPVGALGESDSTLVPVVNCTNFNPNESEYTASDAFELDNSNVESPRKLYEITLDPDKEPGSVNKLGDSGNSIVDVTLESDVITVNALLESDITTGTPTRAMEMIVNAIEVEPGTPENDLGSGIDLDNWQLVNCTRSGLMNSIINPKDLLAGWNWVFEKDDQED
jgi:hypothetical protein